MRGEFRKHFHSACVFDQRVITAFFSPQLFSAFCGESKKKNSAYLHFFSNLEKGTDSQLAARQNRQNEFLPLFIPIAQGSLHAGLMVHRAYIEYVYIINF